MIPLAKDTRDVLGSFADKVSNRSLLFEKMALAKTWGHETRFHDATRFNVLRACHDGNVFLRMASAESQLKISSLKTQDLVKAENRYRKKIADELAQVNVDDASLTALRIKSSLSLLVQIQQSYPSRNRTFVGELGGRLLINMAGGVQENAGISLDRCFGLPLIPGSAAKGVSRHTALWEIRSVESITEKKRLLRLALLIFGYGVDDVKPKRDKTNWAWTVENNQEILGEVLSSLPSATDFKGVVSFLPATPANEKNMRIVAEGLTPHTDQKTGKESDRLNPLTFPAVERGSQFAFALILNRWLEGEGGEAAQEILNQAENWLKDAVTGTGIGAKTSAGYGWFTINEDASAERQKDAAKQAKTDSDAIESRRRAAKEAEIEAARHAAMSDTERFIETIRSLDDSAFAEKAKQVSQNSITGDEAEAFFQVLKSPEKKERRKQWKKNRAELWASLQTVAKGLNLSLD
jgi:CRISPR-associated protein Cmr6